MWSRFKLTAQAAAAWLVMIGAAGVIVLLLTLSRAAEANVYEDAASTAVLLVSAHGGRASGVVVGDRVILTAGHNTPHAPFLVKFSDGRQVLAESIIEWQDVNEGSPRPDYALVELPQMEGGLHAMPIRCDAVALGERVFHVGTPWGLGQLILTFGRVSVTSIVAPLSGTGRGLVGLSIGAGPGSSGGPVFDMKGRLVGIVIGASPSNAFAAMTPVSLIGRGEHALCPATATETVAQ